MFGMSLVATGLHKYKKGLENAYPEWSFIEVPILGRFHSSTITIREEGAS